MELNVTVNGSPVVADVPANELLLDFLRTRLKLTGPKLSCGVQVCGSCTVLVDGVPVSSCCYLACDADGREVLTVEGLRSEPLFSAIEDAFVRHAAVQCGFCIPGMVVTLRSVIDAGDADTRERLRHELEGNLCRCTGYRALLDSACEVAGVTEP